MISKTIGYNGVHNIFRHTHSWCLAKFLEDSLAPSFNQVQIFCQAPRSSSSQKLATREFIYCKRYQPLKNGWLKNLISITWVLWLCSCSGVFKWRWCKWQENVWRIDQYLNSIKKQCKLRIGPRPDRIWQNCSGLEPQGSNDILRIWATFF